MKRLSWIFGLLCGLFIAWIFAPEKGKELRRKMKMDRADGKLGLAPLTRDVSAAFKDAAHEVSKHFKDEIELVRELYKQNNPEKAVAFDKHEITKKAVVRKARAKSKKSDSK